MSRPFANLDGLMRLSNTEGIDIRRPLLRVLTDLYVQEKSHSREEEQQYVELTLRLLPAVDAATRAAVARKLAAYAQAPAPIIAALLRDVPEVAGTLGALDEASEMPRNAAAAEAAPEPRGADARKTSDGAPLEPGMPGSTQSSSFATRGTVLDVLAGLGEAFLSANTAERLAMLDELDRRAAREGAHRLELPARLGVSQRLERSAMQRNQHEFARELQASLNVSSRIAWRIVQDETGESVCVALKALDIRLALFTRIILFLNARIGESVERVFALANLYEQLTREAAAPIVASWRQASAAQSGARFQPLHASDASDEPLAGGHASHDVEQRERRVTADTRRRAQSDNA